MKNIIKTIKATWLCIRFPFLYPRNRFTGLHYNNWTIIEFHRKYYQFLYQYFHIDVKKESEIPENVKRSPLKSLGPCRDHMHTWALGVDRASGNPFLRDAHKNKVGWWPKKEDILERGEILKFEFIDDRETLVVSEDAIKKENFVSFITVDLHEDLLKRIIKILDWINEYPLQWIHCLTSYTELDALEPGWRKKFGMDLCKDLRKQLIKEGNLFKFRVTQIKEKFGSLRFYFNNGSDEIFKIIGKYEDISARTCIRCGKPATRISRGWISPYCDSCYPEKDYIPIDEFYKEEPEEE